MSHLFISVGVIIFFYELVAYLSGLPRLSDFLPVGFLGSNYEGSFYKIVPSNQFTIGGWFVLGVGTVFSMLGLYVKYIFRC